MDKMFNQPVPLIDANQLNDDDLKKQQLLGLITAALKHSRDPDIGDYLIWQMNSLDAIDINNIFSQEIIKTTLNYLLNVGNILDVQLLVDNIPYFPDSVKGEFMTVAEQLIAMGERNGLKQGITKGREQGIAKGQEQGIEKGREQVAINALKEGVDVRFVARITGLDLAVVETIAAQLNAAKDK